MSKHPPEITRRIEAAKAAVMAETGLLHREFGKAQSRWKSDGTRVTAVDIAISENIFKRLRESFPEDQMFSEELPEGGGPVAVSSRFGWVLDPIDGTNNFALGIPYCAISLALIQYGEPVYGVVYDLSRRTSCTGAPALACSTGNGPPRCPPSPPRPRRLSVSTARTTRRSSPVPRPSSRHFKIRSTGSATLHLAYVAAGLFGGAVDFNVRIWDLAAAIPLCRAAGGEVIFLNGEQLPMKVFDLKMRKIMYVAGAPALARRLAALVAPKGP
jgi:myo-inositol-1(or 4)-monophosphatase